MLHNLLTFDPDISSFVVLRLHIFFTPVFLQVKFTLHVFQVINEWNIVSDWLSMQQSTCKHNFILSVCVHTFVASTYVLSKLAMA